ncbi:hypothetical protein Y1Q_0005053 [Alligator mississippiensis]|uniref:Uncharacterized protein n=1 Tax=Alligator mississippiensis TaxID=8496 RepID=A0A151MP61_ALLMI|nr:hypothetical protein Y1Q_0005053 [Alligator mississippiensis]
MKWRRSRVRKKPMRPIHHLLLLRPKNILDLLAWAVAAVDLFLKYKEDFSQRLKLQKQALQLQHHLQNERENCLQRSKWMRERLIQSEALILQLEGKLYTMNGGDPELMAKVQKIQETNEAEVKQIQEETAAAYHQNTAYAAEKQNLCEAMLWI